MDIEIKTQELLKLRTAKAEIARIAKENTAKIQSAMDTISEDIKEYLQQNKIQSIKTKDATLYISTTHSVGVEDWSKVLGFIKENDRYDMLEKRISKTAVMEYVEEKGVLPKGVKYSAIQSLNVRKS